MTDDYCPIIPPISWNNTYSTVFCTLLSVCAAAQTVQVLQGTGAPFTIVSGNALQTRAGALLRRELVARLNTGSLDHTIDVYDGLVGAGRSPTGQRDADDFASRGTAANYREIGGALNRYSVAVPRAGGLDPPRFVLADALSFYATELAAVLAAMPQLVADVAAQAALNVAQNSTAAATVAAAMAAARSAYVTQLQALYPGRGYA